MSFLNSLRIFVVSLVFSFSGLAQATIHSDDSTHSKTERVILSADFLTAPSQKWSFPIHMEGSEKKQSYSLVSFGFHLKWDQQRNLLKVFSVDHSTSKSDKKSIPLKIMTNLPIELEGESKHNLTLVSASVQVVGRWSSPGLTFIPNENVSPESHQLKIFPTGVLEVQSMTHTSGIFLNEGRILSPTSLDVEILQGEFRNSGTIESQSILRFKDHGNGKGHFINSGRVIAPKIEVGSLFEPFYSFKNGNGNKGLINTKHFFGDFDYFSNSAEILVTEQISISGFDLDNQKGSLQSGDELSADFAQVKNCNGSLSGRSKTQLKIRENLENLQGEIGTVSSTDLTFHSGAHAEHLGKIQGTDIAIRSHHREPVTLKNGELIGQKNISIESDSKILLPDVQIHTPFLNLFVPDFALDQQKDCERTLVHCDPASNFKLTSPYCTAGKVVFLESSFKQRTPLLEGQGQLAERTGNFLKQRFVELKDEVDQMAVYFQREAGRSSQYKVNLHANLKSEKDIEFVTPLANIYIGNAEDGSEVGIEASSLRAWANFLFLLDGHVATQNAMVHAPEGLAIGKLVEHPTDHVQVNGQNFPLLCRNNAFWTTQNQTELHGPLRCDASLHVGGDFFLNSEKSQWSFSPDIQVQGDMVFQGGGDFNLVRHVGEIRHMGDTPQSDSKYSEPGMLRVEKSISADTPTLINLYSTTLHSDEWDGNISVKLTDSNGKDVPQFPGNDPEKHIRAQASSRKGGIVHLEGKNNQGIISSPHLFLVEQKGEMYLATKNPFYFEEKDPIQDLMKRGFQSNTIYLTKDLQTSLMRASEFRFHYSLQERFFFNRSESEKFYDQIKNHVVILKPGKGLIPLPPGPVVFSLSPQLLLKQVKDSCQENLMRGYLYEDRPISIELLTELHHNATEYLNSVGIQWNAQNQHLGADSLITALQNLKNKKSLPKKPIIFYQQVVNEQGVVELKPYFYLPPHLLSQAREEQTGNVFAKIVGRFPKGTTAEEMIELAGRSGVRDALIQYFERNPLIKKTVTEIALRARLEDAEPGSTAQDNVTLQVPIRASHFALVVDDNLAIDTNLQGESAAFVSRNGNVTLGSRKTRHGETNFQETVSDQRTLTFQGHLEIRAGKNIETTAVNMTAGSLRLDAKEQVIDSALMLDSHEAVESSHSSERKSARKAHVSQLNVHEDMSVSGGNVVLQGTRVDTGTLQLEAHGGKIAVLGVTEQSSYTQTSEEETGALFWKGKVNISNSEFHTTFVPAQLKAKNTIEMKGEEVTLQAPQLKARETHLEADKVRILQGKNTSSSSSSKTSNNAFWMSINSNQQEHETFTQAEIEGNVKIQANALELEEVKGQVLTYLDKLEYDPAQVEVISQLLEELHRQDEKSISAPGPALVAAVAVAISIATSGTGSAAAAALGMKAASLAGAVSSAALSSLTAQVATQMALGILAQQSPADILKTITRTETLKNVATSAITAGALYEVQLAQTASDTSELVKRIESAGVQTTVGMGTSLAFGDHNVEEALKSAGVQFVSQFGSGYVASRIGAHFANQNDSLARLNHKIAHGVTAAAFAGAGAAVLDQDAETAAIGAATGAMVSEIVADALARPLQDDVAIEMDKQETALDRPLSDEEIKIIWDSKVAEISKIARLTGSVSALLTGSATGVGSASAAAQNAIGNNFEATLNKRLQQTIQNLKSRFDRPQGKSPGAKTACLLSGALCAAEVLATATDVALVPETAGASSVVLPGMVTETSKTCAVAAASCGAAMAGAPVYMEDSQSELERAPGLTQADGKAPAGVGSSGGEKGKIETPVIQDTSRAPEVGVPNSIHELVDQKTGQVRSRTFADENGRSFSRQDFDHPHGKGRTNIPHEHNRTFNSEGRPLTKETVRDVPPGYNSNPTLPKSN
jgi:hypothetical protein